MRENRIRAYVQQKVPNNDQFNFYFEHNYNSYSSKGFIDRPNYKIYEV
jgi:hypothetical protein